MSDPNQFIRDGWEYTLHDPATTYDITAIESLTRDESPHATFHVLRARHLETGVIINLQINVSAQMLQQVALTFAEMVADLRRRGVLT